MLLAFGRFLVVMRLGDRAVTLVLAEREHRQFLPLAHRQTEAQPPRPRIVGRVGKDDDRRLQTLRSMHRHHADDDAARLALAFDLGRAGGDMSEESEQRRRLPPFEGERLPEQFVDRSEEQTSELQSLMRISYAVLCMKNK